MATPITTIFMNYLNPKKMYFWILLLVILLIVGGVYVYRKNISKLKNHTERTNVPNASGTGGTVQIMLFTVDWCPHCKKAKDPWEDFVAGYHNKMVNGRRIVCKTYNGTEKEQNDPGYKEYINSKNMADKYEVKGYPTVKMLKDGETIEFDAKITTYSLEQFVEDLL